MDPHQNQRGRNNPPLPSSSSSSDPYQSLNQQLGALSLSSATNTTANNHSWVLSPPSSAAAASDYLRQRGYYNHYNDVVHGSDQIPRSYDYSYEAAVRDAAYMNELLLINRNNVNVNVGGYSYPTHNPILPEVVPPSNSATMLNLMAREYYGDAAATASLMMMRRAAAADLVNNNVSDDYLAMLYQLHNNDNLVTGFRNRLVGNENAKAAEFRNYEPVRRRPHYHNHHNPTESRMRGAVNYNRNYDNGTMTHINHHYHHNNLNNQISNSNTYSVDFEMDWKELRGNVASFVKELERSKILQQMLGEASMEDIKMVLSEIKNDLGNVLVTSSGGQFFQRLLEFCDDQDVTGIMRVAMSHDQYLIDICLDNHGSRAMQKLIKKIEVKNAEQKSILLPIMKRVITTLLTNANSYHFVTELFTSLKQPAAYDLITPLFDVIADNLLEIGVDKFGCCALHICLEQGHRGPHRDRVMQKIVSHGLELSQNHYGNYVVQYVIASLQERFSNDVIRLLYGRFAYFSMNKYASHVVEKCIAVGTINHLEQIINEVMDDANFRKVLLNETGNYVVQKAITRCNEVTGDPEIDSTLSSLFNKLTDGVIEKYPFLHYDPLGKHVWNHAKTEKEKYRRRMFRCR